MDYQSVVVYTIINVVPPRLTTQHVELSDGCLSWFKDKIKKSIVDYLEVLKISPKNGFVYNKLACMYYKQGKIDLAIDTYRKAIELQPELPDAYCNLGSALMEKGQVSAAEEYYNKALAICPCDVDTLSNLGNVKREQGLLDEASNLYMRALELHPGFAVAHNNLASLLHQQGKLKDAINHYKNAVEINPRFEDAYNNMANTFRQMNELNHALSCFLRAININPVSADAHCHLASVYEESANYKKAIKYYKIGLKLKPDFPDAYCSLVYCCQVICDWEHYEEYMSNILKVVDYEISSNSETSLHPFHSMLYPLSQKSRKEIAIRHAKFILQNHKMSDVAKFDYKKNSRDRIRIGYVSSDFKNHPTSHLMQSIPGLHNRDKYEIFAYALSADDNTTFRSKVRNESEHFIDLSTITCSKEAAKRINEDGIDILINMNGYTRGERNEIFAMRPAPIQVMWLGYPGTSGAEFMDYIITDEISSPMHSESDYTESFAYMPYTYFLGDHKQMFPHLKERYVIRSDNHVETDAENVAVINANNDTIDLSDKFEIECVKKEILGKEYIVKYINIPQASVDEMSNNKKSQIKINDLYIDNGATIKDSDNACANGEIVFKNVIITTRAQYGLPEKAVVYCNFNQLYKLNPATLKTWIAILKMVPNSVLWLAKFPPCGATNVHMYAQKWGLSQERVIFCDIAPKEEHVRRGQLADVCLDTPLCNGHTTNMDMLWSGTPVVTLPGETLLSRVAASQLHALGCPELIASDQEDYINVAVKLGQDAEYRRFMHHKIAGLRLESTLFDCEHYARGLEDLYGKMYTKYCNGDSPGHIKAFQ